MLLFSSNRVALLAVQLKRYLQYFKFNMMLRFTLCTMLFHTCMTLPIRLQGRKWRNKLRFHECTSDYLSYVCVFLRRQKESENSPVQSPLPERIPSPTSPLVSECLSPWTQGSPTQVSAPFAEDQREGRSAWGQREFVFKRVRRWSSHCSFSCHFQKDSLTNSCGAEQTSHCCFQIEDSAVVLC